MSQTNKPNDCLFCHETLFTSLGTRPGYHLLISLFHIVFLNIYCSFSSLWLPIRTWVTWDLVYRLISGLNQPLPRISIVLVTQKNMGPVKVYWIKYVAESDRKCQYADDNFTPYKPSCWGAEAPIEPYIYFYFNLRVGYISAWLYLGKKHSFNFKVEYAFVP